MTREQMERIRVRALEWLLDHGWELDEMSGEWRHDDPDEEQTVLDALAQYIWETERVVA